MVSFKEIADCYRVGRARYPPAHPELTKKQAVVWRLVQTNMYPDSVACSRFYPGQYDDKCKLCKGRVDLTHILWACSKATPLEGRKIQNLQQWGTLLLSSDQRDQVWAVQLAEAAAETQGITAVC